MSVAADAFGIRRSGFHRPKMARLLEKAMRDPSGENAGLKSPYGLFVRLTARFSADMSPGAKGIMKMSGFPLRVLTNATRVPSGESLGASSIPEWAGRRIGSGLVDRSIA